MAKEVAPKCKCCDNNVKRNYSSPTNWSTYCSAKCRANDPDFQHKVKEKYGGHPGHSQESIDKRKRTCMERYGTEFPLQHTEIYKQTHDTCIERHGGLLRGSKTISEKISNTMMDRYGVEYSGSSVELLEKQRNTNLMRHNVEHPLQNSDILDKMKSTNLYRYGVEFIGSSPEIRELTKQSNKAKYNVEYPAQKHLNLILGNLSIMIGYIINT
jgi:hypothetical protein